MLFRFAAASLALMGPLAVQSQTAAAAAAKQPFKLLVLGDSYSAGNGAGGYGVGPKDCFRSASNWGGLYWKAIEATHRFSKVTYVNRACSGGVTADVANDRQMELPKDVRKVTVQIDKSSNPKVVARRGKTKLDGSGKCRSKFQRGDEYYVPHLTDTTQPELKPSKLDVHYDCPRFLRPQMGSVTDDTNLVMLSLGGNDEGFKDIATYCLAHAGPFGSLNAVACKKAIDNANVHLTTDRTSTDPSTQHRLEAALRKIKGNLRSSARIVVNSYPYLERYESAKRDSYPVGAAVRTLQRNADVAEQQAVNVVNGESGPRVQFVNTVKAAFTGHEPATDTCTGFMGRAQLIACKST